MVKIFYSGSDILNKSKKLIVYDIILLVLALYLSLLLRLDFMISNEIYGIF